MGSAAALSEFLCYGYEHVPAKEYALILWDHGGGAMDGVCMDDLHDEDRLEMTEVEEALKNSPFAEQKLSWIGFDACLMSAAEAARIVAPYARYMIGSEESEPPFGWNYAFLKGLEKDADMKETAERVISSYFHYMDEIGYKKDHVTLSCVNLEKVALLLQAVDAFFCGLTVTEENFPELARVRKSVRAFGRDENNPDEDHDLVDLKEIITCIAGIRDFAAESEKQKELARILDECVVANDARKKEGAAGLTVYYPCNNRFVYEFMLEDYQRLGFVDSYVHFIEKVRGFLLKGAEPTVWELMLAVAKERKAMRTLCQLALTPEQAKLIFEAKLLAFQEGGNENGYRQVAAQEAVIRENDTVSGYYVHENLFVVDEENTPVSSVPLHYTVREDGSFLLPAVLVAADGSMTDARLIGERKDKSLVITEAQLYDEAIRGYSTRLAVPVQEFAEARFQTEERTLPVEYRENNLPEGEKSGRSLPAYEEWETAGTYETRWRIREGQSLAFLEEALDVNTLSLAFQVTDVYGGIYMSPLIPVGQVPDTEKETYLVDCDDDYLLIEDPDLANPGYLTARLTNRMDAEIVLEPKHLLVNGKEAEILRSDRYIGQIGEYEGIYPGESQAMTLRFVTDEETVRELELELVIRDARLKEELAAVQVNMRHGNE